MLDPTYERVASDGLVAAGAEHEPDRRMVTLLAHLLIDDVDVEAPSSIMKRSISATRERSRRRSCTSPASPRNSKL